MNTSASPRNTMARKPSHFGSKRKAPDSGSASASLASMGSIGGAMAAPAMAGTPGSRESAIGRAGGLGGHGRSAQLLRLRQLLEQRLGLLDRDARVGDALPVDRRGARQVILTAFDEVALEHHAEDLPRPAGDLLGDVGADRPLAPVILLAVAVRAVDHHRLAQALLDQCLAQLGDVRGVVVGPAPAAAAQDHVAGVVAGGLEDRRHALLGD